MSDVLRLLEIGGPCLWTILLLGVVLWTLALSRLAVLIAWRPPAARSETPRLRDDDDHGARAGADDPAAGLWLLRAGAAAAPLIGLLGTVIGITTCFADLGAGGGAHLAAGIAASLVTTAAGLAVAVPAMLAHGGLARRAAVVAARRGGAPC